MAQEQPFLTDVKTLRAQARANIDQGPVTSNYEGDVNRTVDILQTVLATEIVCVLRYTMNAVAATGVSSASVRKSTALSSTCHLATHDGRPSVAFTRRASRGWASR